jgi:hypothetical protein
MGSSQLPSSSLLEVNLYERFTKRLEGATVRGVNARLLLVE